MKRSLSAALFGAAVLASGAMLGARTAAGQDAAAPEQHLAAAEPMAPSTAPGAADAATAAPGYDVDGIAATVNDQPISDYELRQRVALEMAITGTHPSKDDLLKLRNHILDQLETEKLELQEALRQGVTVALPEVTKRINQTLDDSHLTMAQLRTVLADAGVEMTTLEAQITAQIAWQKVVQKEFQSQVNVTQDQVDAELARYAQGADKRHYLVSEIFMDAGNPDEDAKVLANMQNVEDQLHAGAPFTVLARQFSQSPSAASGGDIGWVEDGQLAPELNAALEKLPAGALSEPIHAAGGYYILGLRERLEPLGTNIQQTPAPPAGDNGTLPLARILLPVSPQAPQAAAESAVKTAVQMRGHITSCEGLDQIPKEVVGAVYYDLGQTNLADLSAEVRNAIVAAGPGEVTAPLKSSAGVELIVRCDKRVVKMQAYTLPTRDQVEQRLFEDQIDALARRYMRTLRRYANVQTH